MSGALLGPGAEFDLVRLLVERLGPHARGIGDDAATLRVPRGEQLVVSTDTALDTVHFRRDWLSAREIGYRAVTAALSDLAAMAATPMGVVIALELPDGDVDSLVTELVDGIGDAVKAGNTSVVGGNLARGHALGITTTVLGSAYSPLPRGACRPGDLLYLTGQLGGPSAALRALHDKQEPSTALRTRLTHPTARLGEARWLAARGAVAAIDISDGLAGDSAHMAAAAGVTLEIAVERVPVFTGATTDDALSGGEEYELLVAAREPLPEQEFAGRFGVAIARIGRVVPGPAAIHFLKGGARIVAPRGYQHFSR